MKVSGSVSFTPNNIVFINRVSPSRATLLRLALKQGMPALLGVAFGLPLALRAQRRANPDLARACAMTAERFLELNGEMPARRAAKRSKT
ncbi:MAG: hypothetical protein J2P21_11715 [Chloracidobacterium sp.]|nr:hypothetical protein [Chloracidobacterium sp.]